MDIKMTRTVVQWVPAACSAVRTSQRRSVYMRVRRRAHTESAPARAVLSMCINVLRAVDHYNYFILAIRSALDLCSSPYALYALRSLGPPARGGERGVRRRPDAAAVSALATRVWLWRLGLVSIALRLGTPCDHQSPNRDLASRST